MSTTNQDGEPRRVARRRPNPYQAKLEQTLSRITIPDSPKKSNYRTYILSDAVFECENRYELKEVIGGGAYGVVTSARDRKTGQQVAIKKVRNIFEHRSLAKRTLRELKLLRYFEHENIMNLSRVQWPSSRNFNSIYMCSELMETDLACVIRSPQDLTDEHCQFFIYQVLRGLKYIHSAGVIHRDLKPRNLLVDSNCDLKICDFGLARVDEESNDRCVLSNYVATRWYRAPEIILSKSRYTKKVDMWSVGCILAELLGRKPLFPGRDSFHQISLIISILGSPNQNNPANSKDSNTSSNNSTAGSTSGSSSSRKDGKGKSDLVASLPYKPRIPFSQIFRDASPLACDMLEKLLAFDPDDRMTVEEALQHKYLAELHCESDEPTCDTVPKESFDWEYAKLTRDDLRKLVHDEITSHYERENYQCTEPLEQFSTQLLGSLPRSKKTGRRKSF